MKIHAERQSVELLHDHKIARIGCLSPIQRVRVKQLRRCLLDHVLHLIKVVLLCIILVLLIDGQGVEVVPCVWYGNIMSIDVGWIGVGLFVNERKLVSADAWMVTCDVVRVESGSLVLWGCDVPEKRHILLFTTAGLGEVLSLNSQYPVVWVAVELRLDPGVVQSNLIAFIEYLLEPVANPVMPVPAMFV